MTSGRNKREKIQVDSRIRKVDSIGKSVSRKSCAAGRDLRGEKEATVPRKTWLLMTYILSVSVDIGRHF